jgi:hypothetical protein
MSVIKFELTEQHIGLVKNLDYELLFNLARNDNHYHEGNLFGYSDDEFDDVGLIVYGMPEGDFDPTGSDVLTYTDEQKNEMGKLISELPTAMKIMIQTGTFEAGKYKTKHHDINWKKVG